MINKIKILLAKVLKQPLTVLALAGLILAGQGCAAWDEMGYGKEEPPAEISLPGGPIERAAAQGLYTSYKESTMWEIQNLNVLAVTPVAPNKQVLQEHDPKELYCVCLEYESRYKVTWSTSKGSPWEKTVRNILVIKTQGDQFMAVKPLNVCTPFCG